VYTAPVLGSVAGEVHFDMPPITQGREVEDVSRRFEGGEVVEHSAAKKRPCSPRCWRPTRGPAARTNSVWVTDRAIDRFTYNMPFDEKTGDTVYLAPGCAYEWTVGPDREQNESAVHRDVIVDMSEDSRIELDGEVVQRDGTFVFEDDAE